MHPHELPDCGAVYGRDTIEEMLIADGVVGNDRKAVLEGRAAYVKHGAFYRVPGDFDDLKAAVMAPSKLEMSDAEVRHRLDVIRERAVSSVPSERIPADIEPTDASAELVRLCGGEPYVQPVAVAERATTNDASGDLVRLAFAETDDTSIEHLFPPPSAA